MVKLPAAALLIAAAALTLFAQEKYAGPPPPKKDIPYLVQANNLIATDALKATEQTKKNDTTYTVAGETATARTPLASPTLVIDSDKNLDPTRLQLFRFEVKKGSREITFRKKGKGGAMPLNIEITKAGGTLYQIRVLDSLENGEYSLSPDGTNDVFCFEVF